MPQYKLTDEQFVSQLAAREKHPLYREFWSYSQLSQASHLERYAWGMLSPCEWPFKLRGLLKKTYEVATKTQFLSLYKHALGLLTLINQMPAYKGLDTMVTSVLSTQFPETLESSYFKHNTIDSYSIGYYNLAYQLSVQQSLDLFLKQETDPTNQLILKTCQKNLAASVNYYRQLAQTGQMPIENILNDLTQGQTRVFFTGRNSDFHATAIILSQNYLVFCDRFDSNPIYFQKKYLGGHGHGGVYIDDEDNQKPTGRNKHTGVYVYRLPQAFSALPKIKQDRVVQWLTQEISQFASLFSLKETLGIKEEIEPISTLGGKTQEHGNCAYVAKKQAVAGLMLSAALSILAGKEDNSDIQRRVYALQKHFKLFDRLVLIDKLINNPQFSTREKDQLLLMTLFRNYDPNHPEKNSDKLICNKIINYLRRRAQYSSQFNNRLSKFFKRIGELLFSQSEDGSFNLDAEKRRLKQFEQYLQQQGIILEPSEYPRRKPSQTHRKTLNDGMVMRSQRPCAYLRQRLTQFFWCGKGTATKRCVEKETALEHLKTA